MAGIERPSLLYNPENGRTATGPQFPCPLVPEINLMQNLHFPRLPG
jgi:hypothetical protein